MSKNRTWLVIGIVALVVLALALGGGSWLWDMLLRMHGVRVVHGH
jgi:hypothetical protein